VREFYRRIFIVKANDMHYFSNLFDKASVVMMTTLADANRTSMTYCVYTVLRYS